MCIGKQELSAQIGRAVLVTCSEVICFMSVFIVFSSIVLVGNVDDNSYCVLTGGHFTVGDTDSGATGSVACCR